MILFDISFSKKNVTIKKRMVRMEEYGFRMEFIKYGLFVDDVTIENIGNYNIKDVRFIDGQGRLISKENAIVLLVNYIKLVSREAFEKEDSGHGEKGRFEKGNIVASKLIMCVEEVYLLYKLCGTMEKTARTLDVCRQTIAKNVQQYQKYLQK